MTENPKPMKKHQLTLDARERLVATGIRQVDSFGPELITAQTDLGQLNIKGEQLHIESLSAETGDLLVTGKVGALSYTRSAPSSSFFGRLFR